MKHRIINVFVALTLLGLVFIFQSCEEDETGSPKHTNRTITEPETWSPDKNPHIISGTLRVSDVFLTIEPGTIIRLEAGAMIDVRGQNGGLLALGTPEEPILFTSAAASPSAGDWNYIDFDGSSTESRFTYCTFEFGGGSANHGTINVKGTTVSLDRCVVKKSGAFGIFLDTGSDSGFGVFDNNTITETAQNPLVIHPDFVHAIGNGNDFNTDMAILVKGNNFTRSEATWAKQNRPYILDGNLTIAGSNTPTLRLEPGTVVQLKNGGQITVGGSGTYGQLIAEGTAEENIKFTSHASTLQAGDWNYIRFIQGATDCVLKHVEISYGGGNNSYGMVHVSDNALVEISHCFIGFSAANSVRADDGNGFRLFEFNHVQNDNIHPIWISVENVTAIGQENIFDAPANMGIYVRHGSNVNRVTQNTTWKEQNVPYFFERGVEVRNNATLTIEPGVEMRFAQDRGLEVSTDNENGKLIAIGTSEKPITFMSAAPSPQPGNWRGIRFLKNTITGTILEHCVVKHGGSYSIYKGNVTVEACGPGNPVIRNSGFSESSAFGIYKRTVSNQTGDPALDNNIFHNNASGDVN